MWTFIGITLSGFICGAIFYHIGYIDGFDDGEDYDG